MNQKQLSLFIRHAFSLTNAEKAAVKGANPAFANAMTQIRRLVEGLPEEALLQDKAWKRLRPQVMQALQPYNDSFRESIIDSLEGISKEVEENVVKSLEAIKAPAPIGTSGPIRNAPTGQLQAFGNRILAENVQSALSKTSIANVKLEKLFRVNPELDTPTSLWMKQNFQTIDRTVRTGILQGASTESIAKQISEEITKSGLLRATKDTATGKIKGQANTVARTAIQSFNRQITEQVWDANADALEGLVYEWTSALDSRVCPTCGPLDGQKKPERGDLPETPIHPNCRCNVVVVDPDEDDDVRTAIQLSETKPTGKGSYASKVRVNGKLFYRKAVEIKPKGATYADYLADMAKKDTKDSRVTLAEYFGGGGKKGQGESTLGVERADWFTQAVKKGFPPDDALKRLVTDPDRVTKLRSFKTEWNRGIDPPKPKAPKPKPKPPAPKPKPVAPKPKPATPQQKDRDYIAEHQWDNGKNKLSHKAIADSMEMAAREEGLAGQHMRKVMEFQRKKEIQTLWSNGREKTFSAKGDEFAHWKNPEVIKALKAGKGKGEGIVKDVADSLEKGSNNPFLGSVGKVSSGAAGHTIEAAHLIVMRQEAQFTQLTKASVARLREAVKNSVQQSAAGKPLQITTKDLYKRTGKTTQKTNEGWLGTYVHEMGHQVHFRAGKPSIGRYITDGLDGLSPLQKNLEVRKRNWYPSVYGKTNEFEQFAETFVQYVFAPDDLKKVSPAAYKWVEQAMEAAMK